MKDDEKIYGGIQWTWIEELEDKDTVTKDIKTLTNELNQIGKDTCLTFQGIKQDEEEEFYLSFRVDKKNVLDLKHQGRMLRIYWRREK